MSVRIRINSDSSVSVAGREARTVTEIHHAVVDALADAVHRGVITYPSAHPVRQLTPDMRLDALERRVAKLEKPNDHMVPCARCTSPDFCRARESAGLDCYLRVMKPV